MKINTGDLFPSFQLPDSSGKIIDSKDYIGVKSLVIYFYPKDETAGCTAQACAFRDQYQDFLDAGAEVIGISSDPPSSHDAFASNHRLPFLLLSDINGDFRKRTGVPGSMLGLLPGRVTYILDKKGIVRYIFDSQLNVTKHISESLRILHSLSEPSTVQGDS
jgi:peroxiredoxin Q/BCP